MLQRRFWILLALSHVSLLLTQQKNPPDTPERPSKPKPGAPPPDEPPTEEPIGLPKTDPDIPIDLPNAPPPLPKPQGPLDKPDDGQKSARRYESDMQRS